MNEIKWMRFRVVEKDYLDGVCCVEHMDGRSPGLRFWTSPSELYDAPDDEQWRDRVAELERDLDEVCQERDGAQSDLSTLETRWTEAKRGRDEARRQTKSVSQALSETARQRDAAEDQLDEARREAEAQRSRADRAEAERRTLLRAQNDITDRIEEAEREAEELRQELGELQEGIDRLRAENERLRAAGADVRNKLKLALRTESRPPKDDAYAVAAWDEVAGPVASPNQPAPQTHFQSQDLILSSDGKTEYRLLLRRRVERVDKDGEGWFVKGGLAINVHPRVNPVLERDGVPTDAGLRRLAEKAGLGFERHESSVGTEGMQIDEGVPHLRMAQATLYGDNPKWRKRLADALREMEVGQ